MRRKRNGSQAVGRPAHDDGGESARQADHARWLRHRRYEGILGLPAQSQLAEGAEGLDDRWRATRFRWLRRQLLLSPRLFVRTLSEGISRLSEAPLHRG